MTTLNPEKLHLRWREGAHATDLDRPRRYTLTHSDLTGDLFLSIGEDYDRRSISGPYTRFMRDEVLAEWLKDERSAALHVYCHLSGGLILGDAAWRYQIFQRHLPQVLQAFRYGDHALFESMPGLDQAPVIVHFRASRPEHHRAERWGVMADYKLRDDLPVLEAVPSSRRSLR